MFYVDGVEKLHNGFSAVKSFSVSALGIRFYASNSHDRPEVVLREPGILFLSFKEAT
jgi:hypothetical protein